MIMRALTLVLILAFAGSAHAQSTAQPVQLGTYTTSGCPSAALTPCWKPISASNPLNISTTGSGGSISLTTSGTSGASTLVGTVLNVPIYGSSTVSVTAATPNIVVTPSPGTGTFTIGITDLINAQGSTTPYTILSTDMGKTVTDSNGSSAVAIVLPSAATTGFGSGQAYTQLNLGTGALTITTSASGFNNNTTQILHQYGWTYPVSDGAKWNALTFPGFGTITTNALTKFMDASGAWTASGLSDNGTTISTTEAITSLSETTSTLTVNGNASLTGTTTANNLTVTGTCTGCSGASSLAISSLTAATTTNSIQNGANTQTWNWDTATTQNGLVLSSTGNTTGKLFASTITGAASTGYAGYFSTTATGVAYGLYSLNSGTNNTGYGGYFSNTATAGYAVYSNGNLYVNGGAVGAQLSPALSTATFTPNFSGAVDQVFALVHASCPCTIANPSNLSIGQRGMIEVVQSATGSDTVTWGSQYKFAGATAPTLSTGANKKDVFSYWVDTATTIIVSAGVLDAR